MRNLDKVAFENAEISGREKALKALNKVNLLDDFWETDYNIVPTEGYCKWDFEIRDKETNELLGVIEAKDRKMPSTDKKLKYGGAQLEAMKYEFLKKKAENEDICAYYLCTYTDDTYYIWDIANCKGITEDRRMCNKTTAVLTEKIVKHCYYFPMSNAFSKGTI